MSSIFFCIVNVNSVRFNIRRKSSSQSFFDNHDTKSTTWCLSFFRILNRTLHLRTATSLSIRCNFLAKAPVCLLSIPYSSNLRKPNLTRRYQPWEGKSASKSKSNHTTFIPRAIRISLKFLRKLRKFRAKRVTTSMNGTSSWKDEGFPYGSQIQTRFFI